MSQISKQQAEKLLEDIATIKTVISDNQPIIKQLLLPMHFRVISYVSGIGISVLSLAYYFCLRHFGTYDAIPQGIRIFLLIVIACLCIIVWILKGVLWVKSVHSVNRALSFGQMLKHLYSGQVLHTWIPVTVLMWFMLAFFLYHDLEYYIVAVLAFGVGIIYNIIGGLTRIWQYLFTGYWLFITGVCTLVFTHISPLIWTVLSLGLSLILFGVFSKTHFAGEKE